MSHGSVQDLLGAKENKPKKPKKPRPLTTPDGRVLPESEPDTPEGEYPAAIIFNPKADNPFGEQKCAIRRCRNAPSWVLPPMVSDPDWEPADMPDIRATDPLVAQIEAAQAIGVTAEMVPVTETVYLCEAHWAEYNKARADKMLAEQKSREIPSWPLHELNYDGASAEIIDRDRFKIVDGDGKTMVLDIRMHFAEVHARMRGKEYRQQVLSPDQVKGYKSAVAINEAAQATSGRKGALIAIGNEGNMSDDGYAELAGISKTEATGIYGKLGIK